jgi:hypothetical protein
MQLSRVFARLGLLAVILACWGARPSPASAQAGHIQGPVRFDVHLGIGWRGSLGPGMRVDIPLSRTGIIRSVDDELALSVGADVLFYAFDRYDEHHYYDARHPPHPDDAHHYHEHGDVTLLFPIAAQWNFIVSPSWTLFPELGIAIEHHYAHVHALPNFGAGARWHFGGGRAAMLFRLTYPGTFQLGIAW